MADDACAKAHAQELDTPVHQRRHTLDDGIVSNLQMPMLPDFVSWRNNERKPAAMLHTEVQTCFDAKQSAGHAVTCDCQHLQQIHIGKAAAQHSWAGLCTICDNAVRPLLECEDS